MTKPRWGDTRCHDTHANLGVMTPVSLLDRPEAVLAGLALAVLLLVWAGRRARRIERLDVPLSRISMVIGLGWSSEAVWELTGRIPGFPAGPRILLFAVLEILLIISMIRADRHVREHGWPGRAGTTAWVIAASMAAVAAAVSHSPAEALLRMAIPLLLTKQWWDGLVGDRAQRPEWVTSWRWTPRRALLALGAIEPGERDVDTVHRERLTEQMVRLEFRRRHGNQRQQNRATRRLARLSLAADDLIVAEVRDRVDRAMWFQQSTPAADPATSSQSISAVTAASLRASHVRHRRRIRTVRVAHPHTCVTADQEPDRDPRSAQDREMAIRAVKAFFPALPQSRVAAVAVTSPTTVRRVLRRTNGSAPAQDPAPAGA